MSLIHQSSRRFFGIVAVFTFTLLAPVAVAAEEEVAVLAPVAGPAVDDTSANAVRAATHADTR